jgi:hypothetical protein
MWAELFSWVAISIYVPALIGIGLGVLSMSPPEYFAAKLCFSISGLLLIGKIGWWFGFQQPPVGRLTAIGLTFFFFGFVGSVWLTSMLWINSKEPGQRKAATDEPSLTFRERRPDLLTLTLDQIGGPYSTRS